MRTGKSKYSKAARDDIKILSEYLIAQVGNRKNAMKIIRKLLEAAEKLGQNAPRVKMGQQASNIGQDVRLVNHERWIIVFRYVPNGAFIMRIIDGRQDYVNWKL
jgi:Plasmid stabilization system protein